MTKLITDAFSCRNANYIQIHSGRTDACWGTDTSTCNKAGTYSLTDDQVIELFNFLIDNIYIHVGSVVFQHAIGIPVGTDCAPLIADLFLEFGFMKKLIRTDISVARKFNKTFRYIDDLLTLNNPRFLNSRRQIYPHELELKKTTESPTCCSYLDLDITISGLKFTTDLYDKTEVFNFRIVTFPHMDSNIPSKPAYGVFISQLSKGYVVITNNLLI